MSMRIGLPDKTEREKLVSLYHGLHFSTSAANKSYLPSFSRRSTLRSDGISDATLGDIVTRTNGFSGREISKLFIALQYAVIVSPERVLSLEILKSVLDVKLKEHRDMLEFAGRSPRGIDECQYSIEQVDYSSTGIKPDTARAGLGIKKR
jgi:hypothetical protein